MNFLFTSSPRRRGPRASVDMDSGLRRNDEGVCGKGELPLCLCASVVQNQAVGLGPRLRGDDGKISRHLCVSVVSSYSVDLGPRLRGNDTVGVA